MPDPLLIANASFPRITSTPAPAFSEKAFNLFGGQLLAKPMGWSPSGKFSWALTLKHLGTGKIFTLDVNLSRQITAKDLAPDSRISAYFKSKITVQSLAASHEKKSAEQRVGVARNSFLNTFHALMGELRKPKPDATTLDRLSSELVTQKSKLDAATRQATNFGVPLDNDRHFNNILSVPYSEFGARLDGLQRQASEASWNAQVRDNFLLGLYRKADQTVTGLLTTSAQGYSLLLESIGNGKLADAFKTLFDPATGSAMVAGMSNDAKDFVVNWAKTDWQTVKRITDLPNMTAGERGAWAFDMGMVALDIYTLGQGASMARSAATSAKIVSRAELRLGRKLTNIEKANIADGVASGNAPTAYGQVLRDAKQNRPATRSPDAPTAPAPQQSQPIVENRTPAAPSKAPTPPTLVQFFDRAKNSRSLSINPVKGNPFKLEIRDLNGKHYVRLPDGKVLEFGEQVFLNKALKHRFGDKSAIVTAPKKVAPLTPEQAFHIGTHARSLRVNTVNGPITLELRNYGGKLYVNSPEGVLVFKAPQVNLNSVLKRRFGEVPKPLVPKKAPTNQRRLNPGAESFKRVNPRNNSVSIANITAAKPIAFMSAIELKEAAAFLVRINPASYPNLKSAYVALKNADQLYVVRDAAGHLQGMATLTKTGPHSWYLGQVAGPRGFGGDIMKRLLGDFEQLAKNQNIPVKIHAYTNKPGNIYDVKTLNGEGFYAKLGAEIRDANPAGRADMLTERRIDVEWNFPKKSKPKIQSSVGVPTPNPIVNVQMPSGFVPQGVMTMAAIIDNPLRPFLIPQATFFAANKVASKLAPRIAAVTGKVTAGVKVVTDVTGAVASAATKKVLSLPKAIFDRLPASTQVLLKELATGQKATTMSEVALRALPPEVQVKMRNMIVLDEATWNLIPKDIQRAMEVASSNKIVVLQSAVPPITIAGAVEWSVSAAKGGVEKLTSFVASASNKLWSSPVITIPMNTSKVIGFVANKGVNAIMVLEMATGGPKIHFYNPTSGAAITGPSIEALKMAYVPLADGTSAVTLQAKLIPNVSVTFWRTGPTMRNGLPRIDGRLSAAGDESLVRVINTWQANVGMVGVFSKVGVPNFHYLNGVTFRPFGEVGANPLTVQSVTPIKGASNAASALPSGRVEATSLGVIDPAGFVTTISTVRMGPVAFTERGVSNLGPGTRITVPQGTSGVVEGSAFAKGLPTSSAIQPNPAVKPNPLDINEYRAPSTAPSAKSFVPADSALPSSAAANQAIYRLGVDPTTGWMALIPEGERTAMMIAPDIANAMKAAATKNAKPPRTDFQNLAGFKSYDLIRALQSPTGISVLKKSLRETLNLNDLNQSISINRFSGKFSDPISRELIKTNPQFFLDLMR